MSLDPLAVKYASLSAYSYVAGNPVFFVDPDGMQEQPAVFVDGERMNNNESDYWLGRADKFAYLQEKQSTRSDVYYSQTRGQFGYWTNHNNSNDGVNIVSKFHAYSVGSLFEYRNLRQRFGGGGETTWWGQPREKESKTRQKVREIMTYEDWRRFFPVTANIGVNVSGVYGVGPSASIDAYWVLQGKDASIIPYIVAGGSTDVGFEIDVAAQAGFGWLSKPIGEYGAQDFWNTGYDNQGNGYRMSGSAAFGLEAGWGVSHSSVGEQGEAHLFNTSLSGGLGLPLGPVPVNGSAGKTTSHIIW